MSEQSDKNSKKRVLMVHNFYQIGGGEHTVFQNEVQLLRDHGHEVVEYTRSNDELKESKVKLILSPFSTLWSFKTYREVKKIIKEKKIDIVHCHNTFPLISPSVYYAASKCGVPVVQTIHNFRFLCPNGTFFCDGHVCELCRENGNFKNAIKNKCYRGSKVQTLTVVAMLKLHRALGTYQKINYIFLTEFNKEKFKDLIDINGSNVFIKPNFVDEKKTPVEEGEKIKFIFAGRLEENKGINLLLERWKSLPADYYLHIYGDGNLKEEVEKAVEETNNIEFYGFQPQSEIFRDLESSCGLIFPSICYEGFPMIIAESFALGVPVLTTDIGNQADVIRQSQGGEVFEPNSEQSFISAVEKMVSERKKLSLNAKSYYNATLNKDSNYALLEDIYTSSEIRGGGYSEVDEKHVFVFAGRLEQNKGILSLIEMWSSLPEKYELHIYGEGSLLPFVLEKIDGFSNIEYYGFQKQEVIFRDSVNSTAVIIASEWYEPFGMSIPESFAMGVPVISTDIGNPGQMVKESHAGEVYKINDVNSFVHAIEAVIENREEYSKNAFDYYLRHLSSEVNYNQLQYIYSSSDILGGGTAK